MINTDKAAICIKANKLNNGTLGINYGKFIWSEVFITHIYMHSEEADR